MTALVINLERCRTAARYARITGETPAEAVQRTVNRIRAEAQDQDAHHARMASQHYDRQLQAYVNRYLHPGSTP